MANTKGIGTADLLNEFRASGSPQIRETLVVRYLKLVGQIAEAHAGRAESNVDDLRQVGAIGLLNAINRFDPSMGSFNAYAGSCIAGEIRHYLRDYAHIVRLPRELQELRPKILRASGLLSQRSHRTPTPDEIAQETGIPVHKIEEVQALDERSIPVSLDTEAPDDPERPNWKYQLVDKRYRSFQLAAEDRIVLAQAMSRLRDASREIIEFSFFHDFTQTEIANHLGISQMQVSRRIKTALSELWKVLNSRLWD